MRGNDANIRRGFTLIELLITAAITAIVALAIGATFAGGIKIYKSIEGRGGARTDVLLSLEKMERDLRSMLALSDITFNGGSKSITFASIVRETDSKGNENRALGSVTYYLDEKNENLIRKEENYSQALVENDAGETAQEKLISVKDVTFTYFIYDADFESYEWIDSWMPESMLEEEAETEGEEEINEEIKEAPPVVEAEESEKEKEEDKAKIPLGVKIELTYEDGGKDVTRTRTIFMPTAISWQLAHLAEEKKQKKEEVESEKSK